VFPAFRNCHPGTRYTRNLRHSSFFYRVNLLGNVVHFEADPMAMVYEYRVDFYPQTWSAPLRAKLIGLIEGQLPGPYLFDFDNLFLAAELPREVSISPSSSPSAVI
jgi:hypothetical protein